MSEIRVGERIRLRDVTLEDADLFDEIERLERSDGGFNDFGHPAEPVDREVLARGPLRGERNGVVFVERMEDGSVLGTVGWRAVAYGPGSHAWNIGIQLLPDARGHGFGTEAQRLVAEYLFATTDVNRVEASTDVENVAEQRSLEKAGFVREGITRGAQLRAGAYHDLVVYAKLRGEP